MKLATDTLARFVDLPPDANDVRHLLDDIGIEVKRIAIEDGVGQMTLELLANRGDHHAYVGIAREISGRTGSAIQRPEITDLTVGETPWPLALETDLCPRYSITCLERDAANDASLAPDALRILEAAEIHSIGPVVDATNLANLELGQPTHAFDADSIDGAITIRLSRAGETCWPLFQVDRIEIPEGTLVIADDSKILAIAGVIGCEDSKTTDSTTKVLLESAAFDPIAVRKASQVLGIHTDSSARFERGSDFALPVVGAGRVAKLLEPCGWRVTGATGMVGDWVDPERHITLRPALLNDFLETTMTTDEIAKRLERYGFTIRPGADLTTIDVIVPTHRLWDVELEADLIEELAKSLGYNDTPISLPPVDMGSLPTHDEHVRDLVEEVLIGHGFYEVITDGFYGRASRDRIGVTEGHPLWSHVETVNALDRAYSLLKNNAYAQAIEGVSTNLRVQNRDVKAFEWTRTFHPNPKAENKVCDERKLLWAIASGPERPESWTGPGRPADAMFLKGIVEEIGLALELDLRIGAADPSYPLSSCLHPNRQAVVTLKDRVVGVIGEAHPEVLKQNKIKRARPCYLELEFEALLSAGARPEFVEPPTVHPVERNLAFTLPRGVEAGDLTRTLLDKGPDWLLAASIVDLFEHEQDGQPVRTVTYVLRYSNEDANRTNDEVNAITDELVATIDAEFGPRGVKRRA